MGASFGLNNNGPKKLPGSRVSTYTILNALFRELTETVTDKNARARDGSLGISRCISYLQAHEHSITSTKRGENIASEKEPSSGALQ